MQRIALKAVVGARALAEGGILSGRRRRVELRNRRLQPARIDTGLAASSATVAPRFR